MAVVRLSTLPLIAVVVELCVGTLVFDHEQRQTPRFAFTMIDKFPPQSICNLKAGRMLMVQAFRTKTICNYDITVLIGHKKIYVDGIFTKRQDMQNITYHMGLDDRLDGMFRVWRTGGHQVRIEEGQLSEDDVQNGITQVDFVPQTNCYQPENSNDTVKGAIIQLSLTQFMVHNYKEWTQCDGALDKGDPLFVDYSSYFSGPRARQLVLFVGDVFELGFKTSAGPLIQYLGITTIVIFDLLLLL